MAKERCVPQRRYNHVAPAEAAQAYETEHGAEGLDLVPGQPPLPQPQAVPCLGGSLIPDSPAVPHKTVEKQWSPRRGTGSNLDSRVSYQCF